MRSASTLPELKKKEREILHADEKAIAREEELFRGDRGTRSRASHCPRSHRRHPRRTSISSSAGPSSPANGITPNPPSDDSDTLEIEGGRHTVVEQMMRRERLKAFPANTTSFPRYRPQGLRGANRRHQPAPNMAGKMHLHRQVALITLMAQVGSLGGEACRQVPHRPCRPHFPPASEPATNSLARQLSLSW